MTLWIKLSYMSAAQAVTSLDFSRQGLGFLPSCFLQSKYSLFTVAHSRPIILAALHSSIDSMEDIVEYLQIVCRKKAEIEAQPRATVVSSSHRAVTCTLYRILLICSGFYYLVWINVMSVNPCTFNRSKFTMKFNCCSLLLMLHMIGGLSVRLRARVGGKALVATRLLSSKNTLTSDSILNNLRITLRENNVDAFIIPSDDPHCSEYTAPFFDRREFVSGFSGSAGTSIVTRKEALLFTDGRYHSQAEKELYPGWTLMKVGTKGVLNPVDYLAASLLEHSTVAVDPTVHSAHSFDQMENTLRKKNIKLRSLESNPVDEVWGINRPAKPSGMIREHKLEYAGQSVTEKLKAIRTQMAVQSAGVLVVTMLDEIAWLFNIRGSDVSCNPVAISYAVVSQGNNSFEVLRFCLLNLTTPSHLLFPRSAGAAYLFIDTNKVPTEMAESLAQAGVEVLPYEQLNATLSKLSNEEKGKVWLDGRTANQALYR